MPTQNTLPTGTGQLRRLSYTQGNGTLCSGDVRLCAHVLEVFFRSCSIYIQHHAKNENNSKIPVDEGAKM